MENINVYLYILFLIVAGIKIIKLSKKENWNGVSFLIVLCLIISGYYYILTYTNKFSKKEALLWEKIDEKLLVYKRSIEKSEKEIPYKIETNDSFIILSKSNMIEVNLINKNNWIENSLINRGADVPSKYVLIYNINEEKKWTCTVDIEFSELRPYLKNVYSKYIKDCIYLKNS